LAYNDTDNRADSLDVRTLIERLEEIESEQTALVEEYTAAKEKAPEEASERLCNAINALCSFWDLTPEEIDDSVEALSIETDSFHGDEEAYEIREFIEQFRGAGGDHEWEGSWFPVTFIRDSYFTEYAEELAEDIGAISKDSPWPACHIDWEAAASALQQDYTSGEFDGVTYWAR